MFRLILILILLSLPVQSLTLTDKIRLTHELSNECLKYNTPCVVKIVNRPELNAYTTREGEIHITKAMLEQLSYEQVKAVGLHEVGHHVLKHYERSDNYFNRAIAQPVLFKPENITKMRHKHEHEADIFATKHYIDKGEFNPLPSVLIYVRPSDSHNITTDTHPSTTKRIEIMRDFSRDFRTNKPSSIIIRTFPSTYIKGIKLE